MPEVLQDRPVLSLLELKHKLQTMALKDVLTKNQALQLQKLMQKEPMSCGQPNSDLSELVSMGLAGKDSSGLYRVRWDHIPRQKTETQEIVNQE